MNIFFWLLQFVLAAHTLLGAFWKFSHTVEETMPSLSLIPPWLWMAMGAIEVLCGLGLVLPVYRKIKPALVPASALVIAGEMILFCGLHLKSGATDRGPLTYWAVISMLSGSVVAGRLFLRPIARN
jgi:NADH:ubiquinone oxidoreductase subunit K